MKKIFYFLLFSVICIHIVCPVSASSVYDYGDNIFSLHMNGQITDMDYWYLYYGKEGCEISGEQAFDGKTSLKCNLNKLTQNDAGYPFLFHTSEIYNKFGLENNDIYYEFYTYGCEELSEDIVYVVYFDKADGSQVAFKQFVSEKLDDGWFRHSCTINTSLIGEFVSTKIGILLKNGFSKTGDFFIDCVNVKICPASIYTSDVYSEDNVLNLQEHRVYGIDKNSKNWLIKFQDLIKWNVIEGEAKIVGNRLIYSGESSGAVEIEASFLGKKSISRVYFEKPIWYSIPYTENNTLNISLSNVFGCDVKITTCIILYNKDCIYSINTFENLVKAGETIQFGKDIKLPYIVEQPTIKVIHWTDNGEISEMYTVTEK